MRGEGPADACFPTAYERSCILAWVDKCRRPGSAASMGICHYAQRCGRRGVWGALRFDEVALSPDLWEGRSFWTAKDREA